MTQTFNQTKAALENSQKILLTTHERTDGDDLGSVLALAHHLKSQDQGSSARGKQITLTIKGGVPPALRFLKGSEWVTEDITNMDFDLIVISGCSQIQRCGIPQIIESKIPKLNIDHHPDNQNYGDIDLVDPDKSSVAELVYDFFQYCSWPINSAIASCLLTGLFTDTGSFMHSNTKESTLKAAAFLMKKGARIDTITKHTYRGKSPATLRAWGKALENAFYNPAEQIIYSIMTEEDLNEVGNIPASAFEGLVETLNKVPEAKFAIFLKQDGATIKGSLRSDEHKGTNVSEIAHQFGGGGHKWASGFSVIGKLIKNQEGKWQVV